VTIKWGAIPTFLFQSSSWIYKWLGKRQLGVNKYFKQSPIINLNQTWQTNISCGGYGGAILVIFGGNESAGDNTRSEVGLIRQAWDTTGNGEFIHISGNQLISYSVDDKRKINLTASADNGTYLLIYNKAFT